MDSSMCSSTPDPEMWIIQGTLACVLLLFEPGFETKLLLRRIDGAIQVRSNVDPTFYSLVGSGRSGGDHHGSSLLENPYIPYQCMDSYLSSTGLGLEKAAINRIFLTLPSRNEGGEILFPFRRERSNQAVRLIGRRKICRSCFNIIKIPRCVNVEYYMETFKDNRSINLYKGKKHASSPHGKQGRLNGKVGKAG
ncbi:UNVERIFIED_CONTAM: putative protein ycf68 [Sesamum calycinum]|uniref:Uncharacterized protein ycf68 n=1 Tax=Sesamum calycinum TaxID=2727403 RepID=A0AAW2K6Z6_9LAMI